MKRWLAAILAIALVGTLTACRKTEQDELPGEEEENYGLHLAMTSQTFRDEYKEGDVTLVTCSYEIPLLDLRTSKGVSYRDLPEEVVELPEPQTTAMRSFNAQMEQVLEGYKRGYEEMCGEAKEHYASFTEGTRWWAPYADEVTYTLTRRTAGLLSINAQIYTYLGGAYPSLSAQTWNFDLSRGEFLAYADFSENEEPFREAVTEEIMRQIYDREMEEYYFEGYEDTVRALENVEICFEDGGMTVLFHEYALGPHAAGMPNFCIPYERIANDFSDRMRELLELSWKDYVLADFHETEALWSVCCFDLLPVDPGDSIEADDGLTYFRIDYEGAGTMRELEDLLCEHVSEDVMQRWLHGDRARYREFDGKLYGTYLLRGSNDTVGAPSYQAERKDDQGTVVVTVEEYALDQIDERTGKYRVIRHLRYEYPFLLRDGRAIFTEYPEIW